MQDKPKMYQNRVNKEFHNNKTVYATYDSNEKSNDYDYLHLNKIRKKVQDIIDANDFIYVKNVHIVLGNSVINKKIIGINNNNLVTIDNEYIPLVNIKDIYP